MYYVYGHYGHGEESEICFYVGYGSINRAYSRRIRSKRWGEKFKGIIPNVKIISTHSNLNEAKESENYHIKLMLDKGHPLINHVCDNKVQVGYGEEYEKLKYERLKKIQWSKRPEAKKILSETMSETNKRLWSDPEFKKKMSEIRKGVKSKRAKEIFCPELNRTWRCAIDAAKELGLCEKKIQAVCAGKRKTHGKLTWKYLR